MHLQSPALLSSDYLVRYLMVVSLKILFNFYPGAEVIRATKKNIGKELLSVGTNNILGN